MNDRTKVNKHKKWLEGCDYFIKSYGDKILFINDRVFFDKLTPCFYIDVKEKTVYSHFMSSYMMFWSYKKNINLYCLHRYGWNPFWKHKGTEDFKKVMFKPIGWGKEVDR